MVDYPANLNGLRSYLDRFFPYPEGFRTPEPGDLTTGPDLEELGVKQLMDHMDYLAVMDGSLEDKWPMLSGLREDVKVAFAIVQHRALRCAVDNLVETVHVLADEGHLSYIAIDELRKVLDDLQDLT